MPRNRVISQTEALYCSSSPATGTSLTITQLHRVQSVSYNYTINRIPVTQFGELAPMAREINETPTVALDFSYLVVNALNESNLGFVVNGTSSAISGLIDGTEDEKNYFLVQAPEGDDAVGYAGSDRVTFGIGNGFMSSYSTEARVGGFPTATVRVEGLNLVGYAAASGIQSPAINPQDGTRISATTSMPVATSGLTTMLPVLKHGDITMDFGATTILGASMTDAKVQRYTISFNLRRTPLNKIGSRFAYARTLDFPIEVTLSVEAEQGDIGTGSLADVLCNDVAYNLNIYLRKPACTGSGPLAVQYTLYGAKLDSSNWNSTIGPNKTFTAQWSSFLGGPEDTSVGLFISGIIT